MKRRDPTAEQRWMAAHPVRASLIAGSVFTVVFTAFRLLGQALNMEQLSVGTLPEFIFSLVASWCIFGPVVVLMSRRQIRAADAKKVAE